MEIAEIIILALLFCIGAIFGSFACCQAWRLRFKETGKKSPGKWSVCLSCGKRLKPTENIPVISWLAQKGKCKSCGKKIGTSEILSELGLGLTFAGFGTFFYPEFATVRVINPLPIIAAIILLASLVTMWILLVYDAKWQELPTKLLTFLNACAIMYLILPIVGMAFDGTLNIDLLPYLLEIAKSVGILAGTYLLLYLISRERLVGAGDWLLALPVAIFLGNWWLAILTLFLSNFLASIYGLIKRAQLTKATTAKTAAAKTEAIRQPKRKDLQLPFGPFLIIAFILIFLCQEWLASLLIV